MYPAFKLVETSVQPTPVHLQVYDGTCSSQIAINFVRGLFHYYDRRSSCPPNSFPIHNTWKVLLPRDGLVYRARN
jgi:hypothetical protein